MKFKLSKVKWFAAIISLLSSVMSFSIGFGLWSIQAVDTDGITGNIQVDTVEEDHGTPQNLDVITISSMNSFSYAAGYGFNIDDVFGNTAYLTGTCSFNAENGKKCFTSFRESNSFKLDIELSSSLSGGLSSNSFTSNEISLTSSNFTLSNQDPTDGEKITATFIITCSSNNSNFTFDFSIKLVYGGTLSNFPNLAAAALNVKFTPKENS